MAISEKTKQVVAGHKAQLQQRIDANLADILAHQDATAKIEARNLALKADLDALKKDIPLPTVVPELV